MSYIKPILIIAGMTAWVLAGFFLFLEAGHIHWTLPIIGFAMLMYFIWGKWRDSTWLN